MEKRMKEEFEKKLEKEKEKFQLEMEKEKKKGAMEKEQIEKKGKENEKKWEMDMEERVFDNKKKGLLVGWIPLSGGACGPITLKPCHEEIFGNIKNKYKKQEQRRWRRSTGWRR